jgi:hypothetical protein
MTVAALSAQMLRLCLSRYDPSSPELPRAYHTAQAAIQRDPWMLSAGVDLRFPFTKGEKPLPLRLFNLYLDGIGLAAREYSSVRRTLVEVAQLVRPLSDFFQPAIAGRVGLATLKGGLRQVNSTLRGKAAAPIPPMPPAVSRLEPRDAAVA